MKKTKIVCSIGPATCKVDVMKKLVENGMNVARINCSHATLEEKVNVVATVKEVRKLTGQHIGILYDTKGPEFRCGMMTDGEINLVEGQTIRIVKSEVLGTEEQFSVNHPQVIDDLQEGNIVLLENGLMKIEVISCEEDGVTCKIINGGKLGNKKSVTVPGVRLSVPFISPQDKEDIIYACEHDADFLALSFVSEKDDVLEVHKLLKEHNREDIQIISKIESQTGYDNIDGIIEVSDGIMVGRGDLGDEIEIGELPIYQKTIIKKCREQGKVCIVATEMLASMYTSARPTRAEVSDIANAVFDGADAVMLSGETTIGKHPIDAVKFMASICEKAEQNDQYVTKYEFKGQKNVTHAIADGVLNLCKFSDIDAIVATTISGYTAKNISSSKPSKQIVAICTTEEVARQLSLNYGVTATVAPLFKDEDDLIKVSAEKVQEVLGKEHFGFVVAAGLPLGEASHTNFLRVVKM